MRFSAYLLSIFLFAAACGKGNGQTRQTHSDAPPMQPAKAQSQHEPRTIDIIGVDQMKFVVKEKGEQIGTAETIKTSTGDTYLLLENIEATPGETLRIRLTTISKLPGAAMSHDSILLKSGVDPASFVNAAIQAKNNDYIPEGKADDIIAHTGLAAGGETVEVCFTVPEKTGSYDYLCSFPGHFASGMKGQLIVK